MRYTVAMKHKSKFIDTYNPNKKVEIRVTNSPVYEDDNFVAYDRTATIKIRLGKDKDKLVFDADDSIAKFIETIDFEDPQQELIAQEG